LNKAKGFGNRSFSIFLFHLEAETHPISKVDTVQNAFVPKYRNLVVLVIGTRWENVSFYSKTCI